MERDFGSEIVRTFGTRLRSIYQPDDGGLPTQMLLWLEHLRRAERELANGIGFDNRAEPPGQCG